MADLFSFLGVPATGPSKPLPTYAELHNRSLTSFNEWHEGTQLEPAASMQRMLAPTRAAHINQLDYVDYEPLSPDFYLEATRREVEACRKRLDMWCHAANA